MRFGTLADWLAWQETLHPLAIDLGLGRVSRVLSRMNLPTRGPFTISVAGTNGKGSCVAMLDSILRAAGYRVGTYTSPHILRYNERITINGRAVEDERIVRAFELIDGVRDGTTLSFFEFGTLAALHIFAGEHLHFRILEVGLGGRLDAVNVVDADVALIATIDLDHQEWLGDNRESIGFEKAGILRPGRPGIIADPDAPGSVVRVARQVGADLHCQGRDFGFERSAGGDWSWWGRGGERLESLPRPGIPGEHQFVNAAAVVQCLRLLGPGHAVSREALDQGIQGVRLPGRFQFFPGEAPVLLDVAHNPQAVGMLASHLRQYHSDRRIRAIFSVMRDKDIPTMVGLIQERVYEWYLAPLSMPRAALAEELEKILHEAGISRIQKGFVDAPSAIEKAGLDARPGDLVLVFGSFFLVSEYLAMVAEREGEWTNN